MRSIFDTPASRRTDFHSLRRAYAAALASSGANTQTAMLLASHADVSTHMRYVLMATAIEAPAAALSAVRLARSEVSAPKRNPQWAPSRTGATFAMMGTSRRVNTPLITINAMVRIGQWTVEQVVHGNWRNCDRCNADHKEVWVCTIDPGVDDATVQARLGGKRTWRVGSTCGPTLEMASDANWAGQSKDLRRIVRLAVDATRVLEGAEALGVELFFQTQIAENLERLKGGQLDRHMQRVLRHHANAAKKTLREPAL